MRSLAEKILAGDERSAARLISMIENGDPAASPELLQLVRSAGHAHRIAITGPPGSGKSTIAGGLALAMSKAGVKVGVIAVDPSSLKGGGALLADRVRMKAAEQTEGVYIRSMADRGCPGGICSAVRGAEYVLEALGKDSIIIESVGAGQSDRSIFFVADTVVTLFTPDYGDELQLLKGGLLEIGDIVVVNKSDLPRADEALDALSLFLADKPGNTWIGWSPPVIGVQGTSGKGIGDLQDAIGRHRAFLNASGGSDRSEKDVQFTLSLLKEEIWRTFEETQRDEPRLKKVLDAVRDRKIDPYSAVRHVVGMLDLKLSEKGDPDTQ